MDHDLTQEKFGGVVGQATQMVVGAADKSDRDIFQRVTQLYGDWNLKRIYYQAFQPARFTPLEEHPATPAWREHRLYQLDWLHRVYGSPKDEMTEEFEQDGFLSQDIDPKTAIALERIDQFPVAINSASYDLLLRVPGIGPKAAERIVSNRKHAMIGRWKGPQAMGVVAKWARPFVAFPGHKPEPARQGTLPLFEKREQAQERKRRKQPPPVFNLSHLRGALHAA